MSSIIIKFREPGNEKLPHWGVLGVATTIASNQAPGRDSMRMRQNSQKTWDKKCLVDKKYNGSFKSTIVLRFSYLRP